MVNGSEFRPRTNTKKQLVVGSALGCVALWLTFRRTDLGAVAAAVERVHLWPVVVAMLLVAVTVIAVAQRWQLLVARGRSSRIRSPFVAAVVTGQMLNVLLPIRLGEFVRAFWISRAEGLPLARVLGTIAVERLADVLMLGASVTFLLLRLSLPPWVRNSGRAALAASILAAVVAIVLAKWGTSVLRVLDVPLRMLPSKIRLGTIRHGRIALTELQAFRDWRANLKVWGLSVVIVMLAASTNYVLFFAFDLSLSPTTALLLFVVLQIGGAPVSTPGNLGVFHYLVVLVLATLGVDRTVAVAYAVMLHAIAIGPKIIAGAIILGTRRTPVFEAVGWTQSGLETAQHVGQ